MNLDNLDFYSFFNTSITTDKNIISEMYMYPIQIKKEKQQIQYDEIVEIDSNSLLLSDLQFIGKDYFSIHEKEWGGYKISVSRTRLETDEERNIRVAKEESYMKEYNKRHSKGVT